MVEKEFVDALNSTVEVELTVNGRQTGRSTTRPVWFVFEGGTLYLLPVYGSKTQWYRNLLTNAEITLSVKGKKLTAHAIPIQEPKEVANVVDRFRSKHGADEIKKYYVNLDAAVAVSL